MKTVIIGAGPAGLSCAYELVKKGHEVEVFEAGKFLGGMARSFDLWGQIVDLGPHRFFSKQKEVNAFFSELIKEDYTLVERQTRIYYNNRYFDYPLRLGNVFRNLSLDKIVAILWYYLIQRFRPIRNPRNFEEWITNRFGKRLFEIFFKHYTEKLWGLKCTQIDADWAAQRIKNLSLFEAVYSAIVGNRGNKHKTLVDQFAYPRHGTGMLYERAASFTEAHGGIIRTRTPIKRVLLDESNEKVIGVEFPDGSIKEVDSVVSTMPLTVLISGFRNVPENVQNAVSKLFFRNTILVYLEIDRDNLFTDNWLYIHSPKVRHGRITNFRNWCKSLNKGKATTILCMEFWCFDFDEDDNIWNDTEQNIIQLAKQEIYKIDLIPKKANIINARVVKIPKCYPVYQTGYQDNMKIIIKFLNKIKGLYPIGRYGAFKYNNQDHSILMGILAAENIINNKQIDLWQINTDTEYHEEGKIKDVLAQ